MNSYDCVVVGAGISGLSAAFALKRAGASVLVVEASDRVGGAMQSETKAGYVLDNGPNTVTSRDPLLNAHFVHIGIENKRVTADRSGARRFILLNGKPELIPMSPSDLFKTPLLSTAGKLRMLAEPLLPRSPMADESIQSFFARRIGAQAAANLVDPFVSGVYAGDPTATSVKAAFPSLWEAEQRGGSIVRGMLTRPRAEERPRTNEKGNPAFKEGPKQKSVLFSFQTGLGAWPQAIARALGPGKVWLNSPATGLRRTATGWELSVSKNGTPTLVEATTVILACPAFAAAGLVEALDAEASTALRSIPYVPMAVVHLGYKREQVAHPLDGFGVLCPSGERRQVLGILWSSSLFEGRAPEGHVMTTTFVGGARTPHLAQQSDEALIELTTREHESILGASGEPAFAHVVHWNHAICQYTAGHSERVARLATTEAANPGLHFLGNYRDGVAVEKCWHHGTALGEQLAATIQRNTVAR
ncbi:MAG: protoporphyrinogen oxidase [Chloroflexaceae bacterium]|jgi:oxygen-dependent protoporphyrinogen oxidase|nr:protoporphyrinogen oxidase [Chloroflexaceae bacterium]